jgi:hypothetical protein
MILGCVERRGIRVSRWRRWVCGVWRYRLHEDILAAGVGVRLNAKNELEKVFQRHRDLGSGEWRKPVRDREY